MEKSATNENEKGTTCYVGNDPLNKNRELGEDKYFSNKKL